MASLSLTVADVRDLNDSGGERHGHLPVTTTLDFCRTLSRKCLFPYLLFLPSLFAAVSFHKLLGTEFESNRSLF